jgi:hypothetical protein
MPKPKGSVPSSVEEKVTEVVDEAHEEAPESEPSTVPEERQRNALMTTKDYMLNLAIAVVMISLPLSEPEVDYVFVGTVVAVNLIWNLVVSETSWMHVATLFMLNVLSIQAGPHVAQVPDMLQRADPQLLVGFALFNVVAVVLSYLVFLRGKTGEARENALDIAVCVVLGGNLFALIGAGVIPVTAVTNAARTLLRVFINIP